MNHVLCGLAANIALPFTLVDRLIAVADDDMAVALAGRADLSRAQVAALLARCEQSAVRLAYEGRLTVADVDPRTQPHAALALLDRGDGSPRWARLFVTDPLAERREKLAACAGLPPDVVEALAADPDAGVVAELALWAAPDVATGLAAHPHADVRRAVAANENTPPAVLAALISGVGLPPATRCSVCDREETPFTHDRECSRLDCDLPPDASCDGSHESTVLNTQQAALSNAATPTGAVLGFVGHPSSLLRRDLAARPDLPPEICEQLAEDAVPGVRACLAENPVIDDNVIRALAEDRDDDVRRCLAHNPNVPLDVLVHLAGTTRIGATLLPRIATASDVETQELAQAPNPLARMLLALRRDLPAAIRDALATDPDAKVLKALAPHPGLSEAQLRAMVDRHGVRVLAKVAVNPDAPSALLEYLTRHEPPAQKAFREIARHPNATTPALLACLADERGRRVAAGRPELPPPVIAALLADSDWQVAWAAAANPSLPSAAALALVP